MRSCAQSVCISSFLLTTVGLKCSTGNLCALGLIPGTNHERYFARVFLPTQFLLGQVPAAALKGNKLFKNFVTMAPDLSRRMKYPYTLSAKIGLFPYNYYIKNNWLYRWYLIGTVACLPLFMWIHSKANSPENIAAKANKMKKEKGH